MGNSGAGKDTSARAITTMFGNDHQILVIDTHNKGQPWKPLYVVDGVSAAIKQLELLLDELSQRKREGKLGLLDRPPLMVVINEWLSLVSYCDLLKLDIAERFIRSMAAEARKYGIVLMFLAQAESAEAVGLEGVSGLKDCFLIIRLCKACKRYVQNHTDKILRQYVNSHKGFTCLVGDEIARHLTHDHYPRFGRNLPPSPILPLRSQPLTIKIAVPIDDGTEAEVIQAIWGIQKSGKSQRYDRAKARYRQVKDQFGL